MAEPTLFDAEPYYVAPANSGDDPAERISGDRRRTERQLEALAAGWHPLCAAGYKLRLHADAPADRLDRDAPGLRCGTCRFRNLDGRSRSYPKCWYPGDVRPRSGYPRITSGPGTDVRGWWPACTDYQAKETPDATT